MPDLKIKSAVLCEEVRREASGKAIILGAIPIGPDVRAEGSKLDRLALYIEASLIDVEIVEIRLWGESAKREVFSTEFNFVTRNVDEATVAEVVAVMVVNKDDVFIPEPGLYNLQFSINRSGEWSTKRSFLFPGEDEDEDRAEEPN